MHPRYHMLMRHYPDPNVKHEKRHVMMQAPNAYRH
jgi:hypothetical protein